ncbi:phosphoadenylyl-sulfate reductase [Ilumatobacter sp.]|uniref:phosphoadenylyl-sulfate reductase n=1 Tax=Ilumatobacter sp. TaxID=1967498 RepID=UPI003B52F633
MPTTPPLRPLPPRPVETDDPIADARAVLLWADDVMGSGICVTASFGDATLVHLAATTLPGVEITLLDTGYLFAETEWFAHDLRARFDLNLRVVRPDPDLDGDEWRTDTDACCRARKVEPLERALAGRSAWVAGVRREDSPARRRTPIVHDDLLRGVVKINPLVAWSDDDVAAYARDHDLDEHPLTDRGYLSIGCWPCSRPVADGDDPRSGRWAGTDKTECGLHVS